MDRILVWVGIAALLYAVWMLIARYQAKRDATAPFALSSDVTLELQPFLSDRELLLYNLISMAVQDHYLVFAHVPLWRVLRVEGEGPSRLRVLRRMALKQLDFVLVHPGSRVVDQVVRLREGRKTEEDEEATQREIRMMLQAAGIRLTTLEADSNYTVQHLAMILDVNEQE